MGVAMGVVRGPGGEVEEGSGGHAGGEDADGGGESDRLFDGLDGSHYGGER